MTGPEPIPAVADRLLEVVHADGLQVGDPFPTEPELSARLGVGRSSVREGVKELRTLGILDVRHGYGTVVGQGSMTAVSKALVFRATSVERDPVHGLRDLLQVREALETSLCAELVEAMDGDTLVTLRHLAEGMGAPERREESDRAFHRAMWATLPNPLVGEVIEVFWDAYHIVADQVPSVLPADYQGVVDRHMAIVTALAARKADRTRRALVAHYDDLHRRLDAVDD